MIEWVCRWIQQQQQQQQQQQLRIHTACNDTKCLGVVTIRGLPLLTRIIHTSYWLWIISVSGPGDYLGDCLYPNIALKPSSSPSTPSCFWCVVLLLVYIVVLIIRNCLSMLSYIVVWTPHCSSPTYTRVTLVPTACLFIDGDVRNGERWSWGRLCLCVCKEIKRERKLQERQNVVMIRIKL